MGLLPSFFVSIFGGGSGLQSEPWLRSSGGARYLIGWYIFHVEPPCSVATGRKKHHRVRATFRRP